MKLFKNEVKNTSRTIKNPGILWRLNLKIAVFIAAILAAQPALADRDLTSVANSAVTQTTTVAKAASLLGLMAGAVAFQIPGAAHWARGVFISGLIGTGIAFGGSSIMGVIRGVFGG